LSSSLAACLPGRLSGDTPARELRRSWEDTPMKARPISFHAWPMFHRSTGLRVDQRCTVVRLTSPRMRVGAHRRLIAVQHTCGRGDEVRNHREARSFGISRQPVHSAVTQTTSDWLRTLGAT
jgi:hypothetical protein